VFAVLVKAGLLCPATRLALDVCCEAIGFRLPGDPVCMVATVCESSRGSILMSRRSRSSPAETTTSLPPNASAGTGGAGLAATESATIPSRSMSLWIRSLFEISGGMCSRRYMRRETHSAEKPAPSRPVAHSNGTTTWGPVNGSDPESSEATSC
jgi:hypothetical protein